MSKSFFYGRKNIFLIFCFLSLLVSCKKKTVIDENKDRLIKEKLKYLTVQIFLYNNTGETTLPNAGKYYFPDSLNNFLQKEIIFQGQRITFAEEMDNSISGIVECSKITDELSSGLWVDNLLLRLEEERIASQIEELESFQDEDITTSMEEASENIERVFSNEIVSLEVLDAASNLRFMEFDDEVFIPQKTENGWIIIQSIKNQVIKSIYNNDYRLISKESWLISSGTENKLVSEESYDYYDESYKVKSKTVLSQDSKNIVNYNQNGLISSSIKYYIIDEKQHIISENKYTYDAKERIISDEKTEYEYGKNYSILKYKFTKKNIYAYHESEEILPDLKYYENDVLKMNNVYSEVKGTYTSQIYFDEGFSVKTYYVEDKRKKEVYYQNNQVTRVKDYD